MGLTLVRCCFVFFPFLETLLSVLFDVYIPQVTPSISMVLYDVVFEFLHGVYLTHKVGEGRLQNIVNLILKPFSSLILFSFTDFLSVQV